MLVLGPKTPTKRLLVTWLTILCTSWLGILLIFSFFLSFFFWWHGSAFIAAHVGKHHMQRWEPLSLNYSFLKNSLFQAYVGVITSFQLICNVWPRDRRIPHVNTILLMCSRPLGILCGLQEQRYFQRLGFGVSSTTWERWLYLLGVTDKTEWVQVLR